MPKRVVLQGVQVVREGKLVTPEIGKAFDFTADEIKDIADMNKEALRWPVNEGAAGDEAAEKAAAASNGGAKAAAASNGGAKAAAASNADL